MNFAPYSAGQHNYNFFPTGLKEKNNRNVNKYDLVEFESNHYNNDNFYFNNHCNGSMYINTKCTYKRPTQIQ